MKKLFTISFICLAQIGSSQISWDSKTMPTDNINRIHFADQNVGWTSGSASGLNNITVSSLYKTTDGGATWNQQAVDIDFWYDNFMPDSAQYEIKDYFTHSATDAWLCAGVNGIFHTTDGGTTWQDKSYSGQVTNQLQSIFFTTSTNGFAVGGGGTILSTTNGGTTWTKYSLPGSFINTIFTEVFFQSETLGFVVGEDGTILKTTNGGSTWTTISSNVTSTVYNALFMNSATVGFIVGIECTNAGCMGKILKTTDGGATWNNIEVMELTQGGELQLRKVKFYDETHGFICGDNGTLLKTDDGGDTWSGVSTGSNTSIYDLALISANAIYMVNGTDEVTYKSCNINAASIEDASICSGSTVEIDNTTLIGTASWYTTENGIEPAFTGNTFTTPELSETTSFWVQITDEGCVSPREEVVVNVSIINEITLNENTLTATTANATYQWLDCDNNNSPVANATAQSFTPTDNGNYAVSVTLDGCTSVSNCMSLSGEASLATNTLATTTISPNPTNGSVSINFGKNESNVSVIIKNAIGQIVSEISDFSGNQLQANLEGNKGIYFIEVITERGAHATYKVIKL